MLARTFAVLVLALLTSFAPRLAAAEAPVEGRDYVRIEGGAPYAADKRRIEVAEVFGYTCPHCAHFQPRLDAWAKRLPRDARLVHVAAPWSGDWTTFARAYYAAEALGVAPRTHAAVFNALHVDGLLPRRNASPEEIAAFYARYGVDPARLVATMRSDAVERALADAAAFIQRSGVEGTPTLVVAGKYRVTARTADGVLQTADWLIARERAARR